MSRVEKILYDIEQRGLRLISVICESEANDLCVLYYDEEGIVQFISKGRKNVEMYECVDGGLIQQIASINNENTRTA